MFIDLNVLFRRHYRTAFVLGMAWDGEALQFVTRPARRVLVIASPGSGVEALVGANLRVLGSRGALLGPDESPDAEVQQLFVNDVQPWTAAALTTLLVEEPCAVWLQCASLEELSSRTESPLTPAALVKWARVHFDVCVIFETPEEEQQQPLVSFCPEVQRAPDWWRDDQTQGVRGVMISDEAPTFLLGLPPTHQVLVQGRRVKAPGLQPRR
ncbi:hypothetical protein [Deinococcus sp. Leaf326]|uniref:hypothetical protein n=1 Tax=Deinococcus sp. Leaf326 TaxID=1736338 RepID=UPI00070164B8|nr:hypothetical protein [Deinococcus sp. Leaf326]KQR35144.1 hypothetical protein ASF71_16315 [Deinococcus sp. Leaf326]